MRGLGPGGSWMAAWMGTGCQDDQQADWRVGTFNPTLSPPCRTEKGMGGLELNSPSVVSDLINHA